MAQAVPTDAELLKYLQDNPNEPNTTSSLRKAFGISAKKKTEFKHLIKELIDQGKVTRTRQKKIVPLGEDGRAAQPVAPSGGRRQRVMDPPEFVQKIFRGKLVQKGEDFWAQERDSGNLYRLPGRRKAPGKDGDPIIFEIYDHPKRSQKEKLARITTRLEAQVSFPEICASFERDRGLEDHFSPEILREVRALKAPGEEDFKGRLDLRHLQVICIDPDGARDHDDAISIQVLPNRNWELGVHIADVSHYVRENTALDLEAMNRSFTQYLPWKAVPMLPEQLSSGWCSLRAGEDRLAFSCIMEVSPRGIIRKWKFAKTVMCVTDGMTYQEALEKLEKGDKALQAMEKLTGFLREQRKKNGILELGAPEMQVKFNAEGEPESIEARPILSSYSWIEECMLAANQCCAKELRKRDLAGMYRVHEPPAAQDIMELRDTEPSLFFQAPVFKGDIEERADRESNIDPEVYELYKHLIARAQGDDQKIHKILRSMRKARYSHLPMGHFALNWQDYAHFTSPIRRYADLWVHRRLSEALAGEKAGDMPWLEEISDQISGNEITNLKNERAGVKVCATWLLKDYIGEEFTGEVSGIGEMGMFVRLDHPRVEGLIRFRDMGGDFFLYIPERSCLRGKRSGLVYAYGTRVKIQVLKVDCIRGEADFALIGQEEGAKQPEIREISPKMMKDAETASRAGRSNGGRGRASGGSRSGNSSSRSSFRSVTGSGATSRRKSSGNPGASAGKKRSSRKRRR